MDGCTQSRTMSSIDRKPHILKSEKSLAMPRHIIFFDTETRQERLDDNQTKHILKLGWACYYRKAYDRHLSQVVWQSFNTPQALWDFIFSYCQPKQKLWCIARNITYDFTILKGWRFLKDAGYKLKFFHNQGTCNIISVRNKGKSIVFLDSMNWFVESLAKTGERIGIPKLDIDFEKCTLAELSTYCKNDVVIELENFKLFMQFLEDNRIARLCYTKGSTAMAAFLLHHYTTKIYIHNNKQAIDLERASYKGGRVECFYLGDLNNDNYYMLDVNSLYPFVMHNNLYPIKYVQISHKTTVAALDKHVIDKSVCAEVLIETDEPVYAVRRARTTFPIGKFWVTLTTPEIKYALEHNHLKQVGDCVVYEQENIFKSYVDKFYRLRQKFKANGVAEYEELCKKFLNTLYGKFGQKGESWEKIGDCIDEPDREELLFNMHGHRVTKIRYLLGEIFVLHGKGECFDSFPAIAAHVAADARLYLWSIMCQAGHGNYFYCDTDSLIVNEIGLCKLQDKIDKTRLGGLKIDRKGVSVQLRGLKDYSFGTKHVVKGVRKNAIELSDGVYQQEQWSSFRGLLRSGEPNTYTVKTITKHLTRKYTKGNVSPNGTIQPLVYADSL